MDGLVCTRLGLFWGKRQVLGVSMIWHDGPGVRSKAQTRPGLIARNMQKLTRKKPRMREGGHYNIAANYNYIVSCVKVKSYSSIINNQIRGTCLCFKK